MFGVTMNMGPKLYRLQCLTSEKLKPIREFNFEIIK
jgi:hypothetical protein